MDTNGALNHVGFRTAMHHTVFMAVSCTSHGACYGALNYVEFRAAMHPTWCMARLEGFEPPTHGLEVQKNCII